jgi:hypothetical protein
MKLVGRRAEVGYLRNRLVMTGACKWNSNHFTSFRMLLLDKKNLTLYTKGEGGAMLQALNSLVQIYIRKKLPHF